MEKEYVGDKVIEACGQENEDVVLTMTFMFYGVHAGSVNFLSAAVKIGELIDKGMMDIYRAIPAAYLSVKFLKRVPLTSASLQWSTKKERELHEDLVDEIQKVSSDVAEFVVSADASTRDALTYLLKYNCSDTVKLYMAMKIAEIEMNVMEEQGDK